MPLILLGGRKDDQWRSIDGELHACVGGFEAEAFVEPMGVRAKVVGVQMDPRELLDRPLHHAISDALATQGRGHSRANSICATCSPPRVRWAGVERSRVGHAGPPGRAVGQWPALEPSASLRSARPRSGREVGGIAEADSGQVGGRSGSSCSRTRVRSGTAEATGRRMHRSGVLPVFGSAATGEGPWWLPYAQPRWERLL